MKNLASQPSRASYAKVLPRGYLSWSQLDLVERDPMEYVRHYLHGQPRYESEAMMFGRKFATSMETGQSDQDDDSALKFLVQIGIPKLELVEHEIKVKHKGIPLFGKLDTVSADLRKFREYKTGTAEWNQSRVDRHSQFVFYALLIFLKTGRIPELAHLDWIRTHYDDETGDIRANGDWKTFKRKPFTLLELSEMTKRIERTVEVIAQLVNDYGPVIKTI